jgi:hypothetical protein
VCIDFQSCSHTAIAAKAKFPENIKGIKPALGNRHDVINPKLDADGFANPTAAFVSLEY